MVRGPIEDAAVKRAHWLAELAAALDEAHRLVKERDGEAGSSEGIELCARIEGVRLEIEAMRLRRSSGGGGHFDPEWINDIPWKRSA